MNKDATTRRTRKRKIESTDEVAEKVASQPSPGQSKQTKIRNVRSKTETINKNNNKKTELLKNEIKMNKVMKRENLAIGHKPVQMLHNII